MGSGVSCIYREGPHGTTHIEARQQDSSYLHGYQDNTELNKERQKSQPPRRRNQEDSSNPEQKNWKIEFKWVKAHAGIFGNEIADRFAKEATQNYDVTYRRIQKSAIL